MIIAFYKHRGTLFNRLIRWWTNSQYSHCEIVIGSDGMSISASVRDNMCVRIKLIDYDKEKWDMIHAPTPFPTALNQRIRDVQCKKYDWIGLFFGEFIGKMVSQFRIEEKQKWYCSEVCNYIIFGTREIISPQGLYDKLTNTQTHY
jgi:hypothetical protein